MGKQVDKDTAIKKTMERLHGTLDEGVFFLELANFFRDYFESDYTSIVQMTVDGPTLTVRQNKTLPEKQKVFLGDSALNGIIENKRPYISNKIERDPTFKVLIAEGNYHDHDVSKELIIPIVIQDYLMGSIHLQNGSKSKKNFEIETSTELIEILKNFDGPLKNMQMYITAKNLNEQLLEKIKETEKKLSNIKGEVLGSDFNLNDIPIFGTSPLMGELKEFIERNQKGDSNIILFGEKGVGKKLLAKNIHAGSSRSQRAFLRIDCECHYEKEIEETLFGIQANDINRAGSNKEGLLELADMGTVLIENISYLTPRLQDKLANFLKDKKGNRSGGGYFESSVRVMATSHKDLEEDFNKDLFYLLSVTSCRVPTLKERVDDLEGVGNYFLNAHQDPCEEKFLGPDTLNKLREYPWPGNFNELKNVLERARILSDGPMIESSHLPDYILNPPQDLDEQAAQEEEEEIYDFQEMTLQALEKNHIWQTLQYLEGNKTQAAKMLGISVKTLYNKLHSYNLMQAN